MPVRHLSILGIGLLGASVAHAARKRLTGCTITGYGHRDETVTRARERGVVDHATSDPVGAVTGADLVVLATPVGAFSKLLKTIGPALSRGAIVTDVGSTKRSVLRDATKLLPRHARFVGSHPMAGSEKRGMTHAKADLLAGARCIITPDDTTDPAALDTVESFWQTLGMHTLRMSPTEHDAALARISHLPHAIAACLVAMQDSQALDLAGKGFADTTRIAAGDGALWRDIFLDNADEMHNALRALREQLEVFEQMLASGQPEALRRWLDAAADVRRTIDHRKGE